MSKESKGRKASLLRRLHQQIARRLVLGPVVDLALPVCACAPSVRLVWRTRGRDCTDLRQYHSSLQREHRLVASAPHMTHLGSSGKSDDSVDRLYVSARLHAM